MGVKLRLKLSEERVLGRINKPEWGRMNHEDEESSVMRSSKKWNSSTILLGWSNQRTRDRLGS
jgi:hypothetical protein